MLKGYSNVPLEIALGRNKILKYVYVNKLGGNKRIKILTFKNNSGRQFFRFRSEKSGYFQYSFDSISCNFKIIHKKSSNPLVNFGSIQLDKNHNYLIHKCNRPFFWFADTWWYGLTNRATWPLVFKKVVRDRKRKGFTVILLVVGIPPEITFYSKESANSGGHPFVNNGKINVAYFEEVDKKVSFLASKGIVTCIVGGWGYQMDYLGKKIIKNLWREIIARYASYPVIFCLSGEIDGILDGTNRNLIISAKKYLRRFLPEKTLFNIRNLQINFGKNNIRTNPSLKRRLEHWRCVGKFIKNIDPFSNLLTVHVSGTVPPSALFNNPSWLDIDSVQTGHSELTKFEIANSIIKNNSGLPIINLEPWYENILGNFDDYHQRYSFWVTVLSGSPGYTYGANGIWQMGKDGAKFLDHWGTANWHEALNYKGSFQLSKAKRFLEKFQWWNLRPVNIIDPHFDKKNLNLPVAATIKKQHYFIYFPRFNCVNLYQINGIELNVYTAKWINPLNMKIIKSCKLKSRTITTHTESCDRILIISKIKS